jgi:hypothetical protein
MRSTALSLDVFQDGSGRPVRHYQVVVRQGRLARYRFAGQPDALVSSQQLGSTSRRRVRGPRIEIARLNGERPKAKIEGSSPLFAARSKLDN